MLKAQRISELYKSVSTLKSQPTRHQLDKHDTDFNKSTDGKPIKSFKDILQKEISRNTKPY